LNRRISEWLRSWKNQDEDSRNAFLLVSGITVVVVIAIGIALFGYLDNRTSDSDAVVRVGDEEVSYSYLQKRMAPFMSGTASLSPEQFSSLLSSIMAEVEQEKLLFHVAGQKGITVSDEELEAEMREDLVVKADATKEAFATALRRELVTTGLTLDEYRSIQRAQVIETKLREQFSSAIPADAEQVNIRLLQVSTQSAALQAKERINNGEAMGLVAGAVSTHSSSSRGGEVNWVVRGTFDSKLDDVMFALPIGTISDVVETDEGFYIVEVRAKETRPVTDEVRTAAANHGFTTTMADAREELGSEIVMTASQLNRLATHFSSSINTGG
jgi:parvulin-like peptidyl-prolyl isomerase